MTIYLDLNDISISFEKKEEIIENIKYKNVIFKDENYDYKIIVIDNDILDLQIIDNVFTIFSISLIENTISQIENL